MQKYEGIITEKGQVKIPQELLRTIGLKPRDRVRFELDGNVIRMSPASSRLLGLPLE